MGMIIIWDTKKEQQKLNRMWDERPKTVQIYRNPNNDNDGALCVYGRRKRNKCQIGDKEKINKIQI